MYYTCSALYFTTMVGLTEAALPSQRQAVVGATVPGDERVDTLAKVRAARNAGLGLGALAATAAVGAVTVTAGAVVRFAAGRHQARPR